MNSEEREIQEILELIWTLDEETKTRKGEIFAKLNDSEKKLYEELIKRQWIAEKDDNVEFTEKGREEATRIIRRHRLAEVLFTDLFALRDEDIEQVGCSFEHILDEDVVDKVCTFLGHPPFCPHGKKIPPGRCCKKFEKKLEPVIQRLWDLKPGEEAKIVFITSGVKARLNKLFSLNIVPGHEVKFIQKHPSPVIKIGESSVAMDDGIAKEIYVIPKPET
jgi:DtxR family Mn-dependent transcriptional regulator